MKRFHNIKKLFNISALAMLALIVVACGGGGGGSAEITPDENLAPNDNSVITSFSAASTTIAAGASVDLSAIFSPDGTGSIDNGIGPITSGIPISVSPSETTTYTLTVIKGDGSTDSANVTVTVVALNSLSIVDENLDQIFQANQTSYSATVGFLSESIKVKATAAEADASITVNTVAIGADDLSQSIVLTEGAETQISIVVSQNAVTKTYTINVSRGLIASFAEQAYIKASNSGANDEFGYSVSLSGDTLAVGAYYEASGTTGVDSIPDEAASNSGAVYVFVRSGSTWTQQAYIKASNTQSNDQFGYSIALSGDTLVVGAIGEDSSSTGVGSTPDEAASNSGAVYVFTRSGTSWSEQAYIKASNTGSSDEFGISVALSGDTLVVGAHQEDSSTAGVGTTADELAANAGAVYVFTRNDAVWSEQAYIKPSNTGSGDKFGNSVAVSGDTLAVGAYLEDSSTTGIGSIADNGAKDSGAVYVFTRSGTSWSEQAYIKSSNSEAFDNFGISVSLSGDTLAAGAYLEDSSTTGVDSAPDEAAKNSGAVYVFTRNGTTWNEQAYIKSSNTQSNDTFGYCVALSGDTLAVGAYGEDSSTSGIGSTPDELASRAGAAYVFVRDGTTWSERGYVKASNPQTFDEFGRSIALSGDTLAVSAHAEDSSTTGVGSTPDELAANAGAVYTFE